MTGTSMCAFGYSASSDLTTRSKIQSPPAWSALAAVQALAPLRWAASETQVEKNSRKFEKVLSNFLVLLVILFSFNVE